MTPRPQVGRPWASCRSASSGKIIPPPAATKNVPTKNGHSTGRRPGTAPVGKACSDIRQRYAGPAARPASFRADHPAPVQWLT